MNLLLFDAADRIDADTITVSDARLTHLREVHRATLGDRLRVGEINGLVGEGEITRLDEHCATLRVSLAESPPAKLPVTLVLCLPRPKMLRRIVRTAAEMGVGEVHLIHSYRVEKSYWQTPALDPEAIHRYLLEGLSQSRDTIVPAVHQHRRFKPFAQDTLPGLCAGRDALLFHPGEHPAFTAPGERDTLLIIGPEGGFIPYEVDLLQAVGARVHSLGSRILRVETAVSAVLGRFEQPPAGQRPG